MPAGVVAEHDPVNVFEERPANDLGGTRAARLTTADVPGNLRHSDPASPSVGDVPERAKPLDHAARARGAAGCSNCHLCVTRKVTFVLPVAELDATAARLQGHGVQVL